MSNKCKYLEPSDEIVEIVEKISQELNFDIVGIECKPLCVTKAKQVCKIVRANDLTEYVTKKDNLIIVLCYEDAFEGTDREGHPLADADTKYMWIRNAMEEISFDSEKDKVNIGCPMISIPLHYYESNPEGSLNAARLGLYRMAQIDEMKKEEADRQKALKTKTKKKKTS